MDALTLWSIRLALLCYALALGIKLVSERSDGIRRRVGRLLWTVGMVLAVAHVLLALHDVYGWRHAEAVEDTARQTREIVGFRFGGEIYFNYLFLAVWAADCGWWWLGPASYRRRPVWVAVIIHAYLLMIAASATIVFESGPLRWIAATAAVALAALLAWRCRQTRRRD